MRIIGKQALDDFVRRHADARPAIESWIAEVESSSWQSPLEVLERYGAASFVKKNCIFNIKGNRYRLHVHISFDRQLVLVKNVGTHNEYLTWNLG